MLLQREIERLENRYWTNRSVKTQNRTHILSALLLLCTPRKAMYDPERTYLELQMLRDLAVEKKLKGWRTDTCQTVQGTKKIGHISFPHCCCSVTPRKPCMTLKVLCLELRDRAVERRNSKAGEQILAKLLLKEEIERLKNRDTC